MAIIITGGCGYVGTWLAKTLVEKGQDVIIFDVGKVNRDLKQIEGEHCRIEKVNVLDYEELKRKLESEVKKQQIDGVIHMVAAIATYFKNKPRENSELNIMGSLNMMESSRVCGINNMVLASSGAVYGEGECGLAEDSPLRPNDLYGATKVGIELLAKMYGENYDMNIKVVRLFFIYGPGLLPSAAFPAYRTAFGALEGLTDLDIPSGADQLFDFNYIDDAVQGIFNAFNAKNPKSKIFNIGSGRAYKLDQVLDEVRKIVDGIGEVKIGPGKAILRGAPLNIEKAKKELGYQRTHDLSRGIKKFYSWIQSRKTC